VHLRGLSYLARSDRAHAVADLEAAVTLTNRAPFCLGLLGRCYGVFGMRDGALKLVSELMCQGPDTYVSPQCFVYIYAGLGEPRLALTYQEQAYDDGASPFNYLMPSIRDFCTPSTRTTSAGWSRCASCCSYAGCCTRARRTRSRADGRDCCAWCSRKSMTRSRAS